MSTREAAPSPHRPEALGIRGILRIVARRHSGPVTARREVHNLITLAGRHFLVEALTRGVAEVNLAIAVGEGQRPPRVEDKALEAHLLSAPVLETTLAPSSDDGRVQLLLHATLPRCAEGESHEIREAGLLVTCGSDGPPLLFNRALFPALTRAADVDIKLEWELTL